MMFTPIFYIYYKNTDKNYTITADTIEDALKVFLKIVFGQSYKSKRVTVTDTSRYNIIVTSTIMQGATYMYVA